MFNDNDNGINSFLQPNRQVPDNMAEENPRGPKTALVIILIIIFTALAAFLFFKYQTRVSSHNPIDSTVQNNETKASQLPVEVKEQASISTPSATDAETSNEKLTFGTFYRKQNFPYKQIDSSYRLPINIKSDTTNFYDFSRKINLDSNVVDQLNKNGFAMMRAATGEKNDFWSAYQNLAKQDVPMMITNDFLLYYFQNNIKSIYKDIEKSVFYDNLWGLNMSMYNTALARYRSLSSADDAGNNALLESSRLELTFFATGLKLLEPKPKQISSAKLIDENKFNAQEVKKYAFDLPEYLKNGTVEKEVALILAAQGKQRSPIFFYDKDYSRFAVPGEYKSNARLNNFFLAMEWMRAEFPLYHRSPECPDCLLDADDWRINLGAASLISSDLYDDLELKNKWAIIYKYISFFSGLRQDLTFLNYNKTLSDVFGKDYNVENIFSNKNANLQSDLSKIQKELSNYAFSDIEGTYPRNQQSKKYLGMRLLQDYFWPNSHIFDYLSGTELVKTANLENKLMTECSGANRSAYRCSGFGLDVLNLLKPVSKDYSYFTSNTNNYVAYQGLYDNLFQQISKFDVNAWNNNIYWMTLDLDRTILATKNISAYAKSPLWEITKTYNTALGGWVDIHLVGDEFVNHYDAKTDSVVGGLSGGVCNKYSFVEQNIEFINELISKSEMLTEMTNALGVPKNTNAVSFKLRALTDDLKAFREIEKKEAEGTALSDDDCRYMNSFVKNYSAKEGDGNYFIISQENGSIREANDGVKLLLVVNQDAAGKKSIVAGPVFNYQESRLK